MHRMHGRHRAPKTYSYIPLLISGLSILGVVLAALIVGFFYTPYTPHNVAKQDVTIAPLAPEPTETPVAAPAPVTASPTPGSSTKSSQPILKPEKGTTLIFSPAPVAQPSSEPAPAQSSALSPVATSDPEPVINPTPEPTQSDPPISVCTGTILDPILCPQSTGEQDGETGSGGSGSTEVSQVQSGDTTDGTGNAG